MIPTRRDMLALGGGLAAGVLFTPVPWKLMDDAAIWTQNWPWIPQPVKGPVDWKEGACTLCPAGCALKVKMAGGYAVGLSGKAGALCALGYAAHQMNWHPRRLTVVRHNGQPSKWEAAEEAFRKACGEGQVAVIDGRPGRAASKVYREFAAKTPKALYAVVRTPEEESLLAVAALARVPVEALGYDLEQTRTILSLQAPLLEGWGGPQRVQSLWPDLKIIQAEPELSRTGSCAWQRVPVNPGGESALAAALAHVLLDEKLAVGNGPRPSIGLAEAASVAGVTVEVVKGLARTLAAERPAVAIAAGPNRAVAALNVLLGAVGARGGIVRRQVPLEASQSISELPGGLRAALLDSTVPWNRQPAGSPELFRFTAWRGGNEQGWLLPAPGFLEELTDLPAAPATVAASYTVSEAVLKPPAGVRSAVAFLGGAVEEEIKARKEAQAKAAAAPTLPLHCELAAWPGSEPAAVAAAGDWTREWIPAVLPSLATKLYRESRLMRAPEKGRIA